jgi:hypothetical protein
MLCIKGKGGSACCPFTGWAPGPNAIEACLDDLHCPAQMLLEPVLAAAGIALVRPEVLQPREDAVPRPGERAYLTRVTLALLRAFRPERFYGFGSQARGTPSRPSDVDLTTCATLTCYRDARWEESRAGSGCHRHLAKIDRTSNWVIYDNNQDRRHGQTILLREAPGPAGQGAPSGPSGCHSLKPANRWLVSFDHSGITSSPGEGPADATVAGSASDLWLFIMGRRSPEEMKIESDKDLAASWGDLEGRF